MKRTFALLLIILLPTLLAAQVKQAREIRPVVFRNVTLIDMTSEQPKPNMTIVISGNRVAEIGKSVRIPRNAQIIDASGKFLIPGLWDMHVHTVHPSYLALFVANGVTGIRDMGGAAIDTNEGCESIAPKTLMTWRERIRSGNWIGPRMLISGPAVSNTGWATSLNIRTPDEAKNAVKTLQTLGVDFIKVYEKIPLAAYQTLARGAKAVGLPIAGHVPVETVSLVEAAQAGQRSVEHIRDPLLMCFTKNRNELLQFFKEDNWSETDIEWGLKQFEQCPKVIKAFQDNDTWLVPTLTVERAKIAVEDPKFVKDSRRKLLPKSVQQGFNNYVTKKLAQPAAKRKSERLWWISQKQLVTRMRAERSNFLAGTDSACEGGLPGFSLHEELKLLVEAGFTPLEALQTATINPAKYLNLTDSLGTIEKGKLADSVLLDANPLADISNTRKINAVIADGRYLSKETLEKMLADVETAVKEK